MDGSLSSIRAEIDWETMTNIETKEYYEARGHKYADWQENRYQNFNSLFDEVSWIQFSEYLPEDKNARILDAGCGGGGWSLRLAKLGYSNLTLVDFCNSCIEGSKRIFEKNELSGSADFVVADLAELSQFPDESFDYIFCERDPLMYCNEKQDAAFNELIRVLSINSVLTISLGTEYRSKQRLVASKQWDRLFEFEKTGLIYSEEGWIKPANRKKILQWFKDNNIEKLKIAGRLTLGDLVDDSDWAEVYQNPQLKERLLAMELEYEKDESLADYSSHIFAAGRKLP
jgi:ubiquinone/menaquinone biosynthesis C-methylase UbiE